jgi:hypothetical protein
MVAKDEASPIVDNARSSSIPNQDQKRVPTFLSPQIIEREAAPTQQRPAPLAQVYLFVLNPYFYRMVQLNVFISQ